LTINSTHLRKGRNRSTINDKVNKKSLRIVTPKVVVQDQTASHLRSEVSSIRKSRRWETGYGGENKGRLDIKKKNGERKKNWQESVLDGRQGITQKIR